MSARREEKTTEFYGLLGSMALTERSDGGKACDDLRSWAHL